MNTRFKVKLNCIEDVKEFVNIVSKFESGIDAISGRYIVDAKSIMGVFSLNLMVPFEVMIHSADNAEIVNFCERMEKFKYEDCEEYILQVHVRMRQTKENSGEKRLQKS